MKKLLVILGMTLAGVGCDIQVGSEFVSPNVTAVIEACRANGGTIMSPMASGVAWRVYVTCYFDRKDSR